MKVIKINEEYESAFLPFLSEFPGTPGENTIRIGALTDDLEAAGVLAASITESGAYITAFYVLPDFRRQGVGKALLDEFSALAHEQGSDAIQADFPYRDDAAEFFAAQGFTLFYTGEQYYFTIADFKRSRMYKRYIKEGPVKSVVPVSSLPSYEWKKLYWEPDNKGLDPDYSSVSIKDGKLASCMLALLDGKELSITWLAVYTSNIMLILYHLRYLTRKVEEMHPGEDDIRIRMCFEDTDFAERLIRFLGGKGHVRSEGKIVSAIRLEAQPSIE